LGFAAAGERVAGFHPSITPPLHHSTTPSLHHSITPSLHHSITPSPPTPPALGSGSGR
jgi:hypothetical protein